MKLYRIFSNDRAPARNNVPLYSCLMEVTANTPEDAGAQAHPAYGVPRFASIIAIEWPPTTSKSKAWLKKHVDIVGE